MAQPGSLQIFQSLSLDLHALAASPVDAKTFYAYGDPDFYVSEDGGANWTKIVPDFSRGACPGQPVAAALDSSRL